MGSLSRLNSVIVSLARSWHAVIRSFLKSCFPNNAWQAFKNWYGQGMSIVSELIAFIRQPVFTAARVPMNAQSISDLLRLLGLTIMLAFVSVMTAGSLYVALSGAMPEVSEGFQSASQSENFIFTAVILAPFVEELFFRSWMGRVWGVMLAMPVILCLSAILAVSTQSEAYPSLTLMATFIVMGSLMIYVRRYHQTKHIDGVQAQMTRDIFPYVFWGTAILFGLAHMSNYADQGFQPLLVLLIIPQLIVGVVVGFVRMRFGLLQAIGFHAAYNGVFVTLSMMG